jgi:probable rRNA maturation factor
MNRLYRRKNEPTDVLSFPSQSPKLIGDIAISGEIAAASAAELGHPAETELKILILHGLLHLAGYDHETDKGEMRAYESRLRQQFGLPTGLIERVQLANPEASRTRGKANFTARQPNKSGKPKVTAKTARRISGDRRR